MVTKYSSINSQSNWWFNYWNFIDSFVFYPLWHFSTDSTIFWHAEFRDLGVPRCDLHFQELAASDPVQVFVESSESNLIITGNNNSGQTEIHVPSGYDIKITDKGNGETIVEKSYKKSPKKAKQVLFSDFQKTDPVLKLFKDLEEPQFPKKSSSIDFLDDFLE